MAPAEKHTNPFVGLRPFETDEAALFFGRSEQTSELLQQLHRTRLLAIVGGSGCGKSSLVRAGLIPRLRAGMLVEDRDRWVVVTMKPGDSPSARLVEALVERVPKTQRVDTTERLHEAIASLDATIRCIRCWLPWNVADAGCARRRLASGNAGWRPAARIVVGET